MPATKRQKPLYQRGKYALYSREGRANLEIVWYDDERKRERSASAGTGDLREGIKALDRKYLTDDGDRLCPVCHRAWNHEGSPLVTRAITDYLILKEGKADYIRHRLGHVLVYLADTKLDATVCAQVDEDWIERFRKWALAQPVTSPTGKILRQRSLSHVEGSVMQLAAAITAAPGEQAKFKARQQVGLSRSPKYRVDVAGLAAMFAYCLNPVGKSDKERAQRLAERETLLAYLRFAVATWARPEAVLDATREQWHPAARIYDLNPPRRALTDKRRPMLPVARQLVPHLDAMGANWIMATTIRSTWDRMRIALNLPGDREAGPKLIRRSMATIVRKRIGEANWRQGEIWLGHVAMTISDIYALPDPANLGLALAATEEIIDEIEAAVPGAYRPFTAVFPKLSLVGDHKNG